MLLDLEKLPYPFKSDSFDEVHAYEVLEHTGQQGDWKFFFDQFTEFWRILKPGGFFFATTPSWKSAWAWGDPSHKRIISDKSLIFLIQEEYEKQIGITPMSDFRFYYKANFAPVLVNPAEADGETLAFVLRAVK